MNPTHEQIEEGELLHLDFGKIRSIGKTEEDVIPVVVQEHGTGEVLIIAYANRQALDYSLKNRVAAFWSTSRNELWVKGKTSGDTLTLIEARVNCEQNSILYIVSIDGEGACHTKDRNGKPRKSCFYRTIMEEQKLKKIESA